MAHFNQSKSSPKREQSVLYSLACASPRFKLILRYYVRSELPKPLSVVLVYLETQIHEFSLGSNLLSTLNSRVRVSEITTTLLRREGERKRKKESKRNRVRRRNSVREYERGGRMERELSSAKTWYSKSKQESYLSFCPPKFSEN